MLHWHQDALQKKEPNLQFENCMLHWRQKAVPKKKNPSAAPAKCWPNLCSPKMLTETSDTNKNICIKMETKNSNKNTTKNFIYFDFNIKDWQGITDDDIKDWSGIYKCDVKLELLKMRQWFIANPDKTKKNYRRFIINWLNAENKGAKNGTDRKRDSGDTKPKRPSKYDGLDEVHTV